ncbi:hypothetical protein [Nonomuraea sp. NPDC003804]|uniref:hypothetical protein n=1 Tax=Nonomuraea sp. NPDC003804 TaxID=3154547 RepID=UPI0033A6080E
MTALLDEGRHSWDPSEHPRDGDGQFASTGGGGRHSKPSTGGSGRGAAGGRLGMPDTIASSQVTLSKGGTASISRTAGGETSISNGSNSKKLSKQQAKSLFDTLAVSTDWDDGDSETLPGIGKITRQRGGVNLALDDGPTMDLADRDITRMERAHEQTGLSSRVDTGNGAADVFVDGKKIGIRTPGGEVTFNRSSFAKIDKAIDALIDDMDDPDTPARDTYSKTVSTNAGKVSVEITGDWGSEDSRMEIRPADGGDWGITIDGPHHSAWGDAMSQALDEAERPMQHALSEHVSLAEAAGGQAPKGRKFRARIIAGDVQGSSGYYPAAMLKRDAGVFREGLPVFLDHPGATESYDRPERSVRDLAGRLASTAVYERDGLYADVEVYPHWAPVIEAMASDIGMSIRASGTVEASQQEGVRGPIVTGLTEAASVDFVTAAGAGGKIVALLESARAQSGDLLRKAVDTRAKPKGEAEVEDERLTEARNVGHWIESRIHRSFTEMCDDMFGEGRLTRDERISLSNAIGEGLGAFNRVVAEKVPHLYERDLWDDITPSESAAMSETLHDEPTTTDPAPSEVAESQNEPGSSPAVENEREGEMPELNEDQARELEEARKNLEAEKAQALQEAAAAKAEAEKALKEAARLRAAESARPIAVQMVTQADMPAAARVRVLDEALKQVPLTEDNKLDEAGFKARVDQLVTAEASYLASLAEAAGVGQVRGLGESTTSVAAEQERGNASLIASQLEEAYKRRGMSDEAAKLAAAGRP